LGVGMNNMNSMYDVVESTFNYITMEGRGLLFTNTLFRGLLLSNDVVNLSYLYDAGMIDFEPDMVRIYTEHNISNGLKFWSDEGLWFCEDE
jgi:hypothetical protein